MNPVKDAAQMHACTSGIRKVEQGLDLPSLFMLSHACSCFIAVRCYRRSGPLSLLPVLYFSCWATCSSSVPAQVCSPRSWLFRPGFLYSQLPMMSQTCTGEGRFLFSFLLVVVSLISFTRYRA